MKITVNRNVLLEALKFSNNVINNGIINSANPILQCVYLKTSDKKLEIISSNGIISAKYTISENIDIENI